MKEFFNVEPLRAFVAIRTVIYLVVGIGAFGLAPEHAEAIIAILAVVFGVDLATSEDVRSRVFAPASVDGIVGTLFVMPAGRYVRGIVEELVPPGRVTDALALVAPIALEYAMRSIDDTERAAIQRRVHEVLRAARLLRGRDISPPPESK